MPEKKWLLVVLAVVMAPPLCLTCLSLGILASYLMKPYSGLFLLLGLPFFGLAMFALIFWRNPPKIAASLFDPDQHKRELERDYPREG